MLVNNQPFRTVWWDNGVVKLIEQRLLPHRFEIVDSPTHVTTAAAIRDMIVRGAPAIGATAAFGMAQVLREAAAKFGPSPDAAATPARQQYIDDGFELLRATRPTAQNLFHAIDHIRIATLAADPANEADAALKAAEAFADAEVEACREIGEAGASLITDGMRVLTHCNAGWLACVDWGTALAPLYVAHRQGRKFSVFADETRPRCQGANLTLWELMQEGIDCALIADNAAGLLMKRGEVQLVITGADRIAANGDAANKIGTYEKALLAREHNIPFYVAAPLSTFDPACNHGDDIPIEERHHDELLYAAGQTDAGEITRVRLAPKNAQARNPAFDVTPAKLIKGFITERGIIEASRESLEHLFRVRR